MFPKKIALLGSTGSIGENTLEVISQHPDLFEVVYLTANKSVEKLADQAKLFKPKAVVIGDESRSRFLKEKLGHQNIGVYAGNAALEEVVKDDDVNFVVNALVGFSGLCPTVSALRAKKHVALANKETLVVAGDLINTIQEETNAKVLPVDSEHSAIFQSLQGEDIQFINKLILTASGGPFRTLPVHKIKDVTVEQALNHPNWKMGSKITIDSATMMNKGLEMIEAKWLFGIESNKIDIVIHPQSIIHSMVEFVDGSIKAQLSLPEMKLPIQYALSYPKRIASNYCKLDWKEINSLTFEPPDFEKFPCLELAYGSAKQGGASPLVLNAANEVAVASFLKKRIRFMDIPMLIEKALSHFQGVSLENSSDLLSYVDLDHEVRAFAEN